MKKIEINTLKAPKAIGAYSQAVVTGNLVFVSGQIPLDSVSSDIPEGIAEQTKLCLENLKAILLEAGSSLDNVVKCGIFVKNMDDFSSINNIYQTYFSKPFPARFVVEVSALPRGVLIEMDAIAFIN